MMDSERQIQKKKNLRKLIKLKDTHKEFVKLGLDDESSVSAERAGKDPSDITDTFIWKLWTRIQVDAGYIWRVYRDGVFYRDLEPGPHILWNTNLFGKWQVMRIDMHTIPLKFVVDGRLKGPSLPEGTAGETYAELALTGRAIYNVWCEIEKKEIERFLKHSAPIEALYHIMNHLVNAIRPKYSYDKYGLWANKLAQELESLLTTGPQSTEHIIGLKVLKVLHDLDESNKFHDKQSMEMFEREQEHLRQLQEAKLQSKKEEEMADSYVRQSQKTAIPTALLKLGVGSNTDISKEWIKGETKVKIESIKAGQHPGLPITPIYPSAQTTPQISQAETDYPRLNQVRITPSSEDVSEAATPHPSIEKSTTQPLDDNQQNSALAVEKLSDGRKAKEIEKLKRGGFECPAERIELSDKWVIQVYPPSDPNFRIGFHCPIDYPSVPPTVMVTATPNEWTSFRPTILSNWRPSFWLLYIAEEVCDIMDKAVEPKEH